MLKKEDKDRIKKRDKFICYYCNCNNKSILTIDHKIPISRNGSDSDTNIVCCCEICNKLKGNMTEKEFKLFLKGADLLQESKKLFVRVSVNVNYNFGDVLDNGKKK